MTYSSRNFLISVGRGSDVRVPRSESLEVGLSWKPEWDYPKPSFGRDGRAVMRDARDHDRDG